MILSEECAKVVTPLRCGDPRCECHRDPKPGRNGPTVRVHCPAHDDPHPDLTVTDRGSGQRPLLHCHSQRCSQDAIIEALRAKGAWGPETDWRTEVDVALADRPIHHVYVDEHGQPLHRTERRGSGATKKIIQEFLVPPGRWVKRAPRNQRYVLYRLPELLGVPENSMICLTEGEKNAEDLIALGFIATTNAMGALAWRADYNRYFAGHLVVLFEDNDPEGRARTERIAPELTRAGAVVKVIRLPGLPPKGDVSDWILRGGTKEQLEAIIEETLIWIPPPPVDPAELDRELNAILATARTRTDWTWRREGDDFTFWFPDKTRIWVRRLHERGDGLSGEIDVENAAYGRLDYGRLDLSSRSQQDGLIKKLQRKAPALAWDHHVEEMCYTVVHEFRRGFPEIAVKDIELQPLRLAMAPWDLLDEPNIIYAKGGSGKSLTSQIKAVALVTGTALPGGLRPHPDLCGPLLYLDYETSPYTFKRRIRNIAEALHVDVNWAEGAIFYRRMSQKLLTAAPEIRSIIARQGIRTVVVDSWKHACGSNATGDPADAVNEAFGALRTFERTSLIVAHPPKQAEGDDSIPGVYSSIFNENSARSMVYLKKLGDPKELEMKIVLQQTKENDLFRGEPIGLTYVRERERDAQGNEFPCLMGIKTHDLTAEPAAQVSAYAKLKAILIRARGRRVPTAEMANTSGLGQKVVATRLGEHPNEIGSAPDPNGKRRERVWFLLDTRHEDPGE